MTRVFAVTQPAVVGLGALVLVTGMLRAQQASPTEKSPSRFATIQDWSSSRVIYTRNGSDEDIAKVQSDPRFLQSVVQHYLREHGGVFEQSRTNEVDDFAPGVPWEPIQYPPFLPAGQKHSKVDWSMSLGPSGGEPLGETPSVYTANYASPNCTNDFVVYTINATPGVGTQANLIGMNNLYSNYAGTGLCAVTGPSFIFSYAIGSGGSPLSPVLSLDGTKVAWIENRTANASYLHVTIWASGDGTTTTGPIAPTSTFSNGACSLPSSSCDFALEYTNATYSGCPTAYVAGNTHSDLYVDYNSNTAFVAANNGLLYHIKNIFSSTASPSVDFCIPVNTGFEATNSSAMSGPVYDILNNEVFITDSEKIYAYTVNASATTPNFALAASYTYGNSGSNYNYPTGPGPLLDVLNGYVYVFSTYDAAGKTSVTQLPVSLASSVPVELGPKSTNTNPILFYGAFDNNYYNNGPKSALSTLYSCGTDQTTTTEQDLFAISFNATSGLANTTPVMSYNKNVNPSGTAGLCSPLTEFYDGTNDRLFVGMGQPGASTGSNVVTMWTINSQLTNTSGSGGTMPTYTAEATGYLGGASGMAADNNATGTAQAENIYFSTEQLGTASTAVPATTAYNVNGIYTDGTKFSETGGLDDDGNAYSSNLLGTSVTWNGTTYTLGAANGANAWQNVTVTLPAGNYSTISFLGNAVNGNLPSQTFVVTYSDNSTTTITQSISDWYTPQNYRGESIAKSTAYRDEYNGTKDNRTFDLFGYTFPINPTKTTKSLTLPGILSGTTDNVVVILGISLSSNCGGADYCAVKLTQSGLQ